MSAACDLAVIGAGPAGLSTAIQAAEIGLNVILMDEQASPGGQIYRSLERASPLLRDILGPDYETGAALIAGLRQSAVKYCPDTSVWQLAPDTDGLIDIGTLKDGRAGFIKARRLLIAGGAMERPFPIPGWTLPGVMTAGAGQILLKSALLLPEGPLILAGCGPLLYLLAWQYLRAGVAIAALLDTTPRANFYAAAPLLPAALSLPGALRKGLTMLRTIRAAGIPCYRHITGLRALGETRLRAVEYRQHGRWRQLDAALLLLHQGVVPNVQMTRVLGCGHVWDYLQLCWRPRLDSWGNTDIDNIMVAGDGGGILGAHAAQLSGRLAALDSACRLGRLNRAERDRRAVPLRRELRRERRLRRFLDTLYRPLPQFRIPADRNTLVCRCEEVSAGDIRRAVQLGCVGPNQAKAFCRAGMGPCQGQLCGLTVAEIIAAERGVPVADVGYYRLRPPIKPLTLGQLAAAGMPDEERSRAAP